MTSTVLITGANAGLGYFTSHQLAHAGASIIMTGRNPAKLAAAQTALTAAVPDANVETMVIDVSRRTSIEAAVSQLHGRELNGLVLNAGIVHPPRSRHETVDGWEVVFATNVLGHFLLAGLLLEHLTAGAAQHQRASRMVWLGSVATSLGRFDPVDPQLHLNYSGWRAYAQSKAMTQALGFEANRRLSTAGKPVISVVAHPGYSLSGLTRTEPGVNEPTRTDRRLAQLLRTLAQSKEAGAEPIVQAVLGARVNGGDFWGPRWRFRGPPRLQRPSTTTGDPAIGARVWQDCEDISGMSWPTTK